MSSFPPPEVPYEVPSMVRVTDAYTVIVGVIHDEPDVEVLARSGDQFFRFYSPKHAKVVRDFWKHIGVTDTGKLQEGAYQDTRGGCGPYTLSGLAIGEDLPEPEAEVAEGDTIDIARDDTAGEAPVQRSVGTRVLIGVTIGAST